MPNKHGRCWMQFSIRTMLIVVTLLAVATHAGRPWWSTRLLVYLIEKQDRLLHEYRFDEAEAVANLAMRCCPDQPVARSMVVLSKSCRDFVEGNRFVESGGPNHMPADELTFLDVAAWEELSSRRRSQKCPR